MYSNPIELSDWRIGLTGEISNIRWCNELGPNILGISIISNNPDKIIFKQRLSDAWSDLNDLTLSLPNNGLDDLRDFKCFTVNSLPVIVLTVDSSQMTFTYQYTGGIWSDLGPNWTIDWSGPNYTPYAVTCCEQDGYTFLAITNTQPNPSGFVKFFKITTDGYSDLNVDLLGLDKPTDVECCHMPDGTTQLMVTQQDSNKVTFYSWTGSSWSATGTIISDLTQPYDSLCFEYACRTVVPITEHSTTDDVRFYIQNNSGGWENSTLSSWNISGLSNPPAIDYCKIDGNNIFSVVTTHVTGFVSDKIRFYAIPPAPMYPIVVSDVYALSRCSCSGDLVIILSSDISSYIELNTLALDDVDGVLAPYLTINTDLIPVIEKMSGLHKSDLTIIQLKKSDGVCHKYTPLNCGEEKSLTTPDYQLACCFNQLFLAVFGDIGSDLTHIPGTDSDLICFVLNDSDLADCSDCIVWAVPCNSDAANYQNLSKILIMKF